MSPRVSPIPSKSDLTDAGDADSSLGNADCARGAAEIHASTRGFDDHFSSRLTERSADFMTAGVLLTPLLPLLWLLPPTLLPPDDCRCSEAWDPFGLVPTGFGMRVGVKAALMTTSASQLARRGRISGDAAPGALIEEGGGVEEEEEEEEETMEFESK